MNLSEINVTYLGGSVEKIFVADTREFNQALETMYMEIDLYLANRRIFKRSWGDAN